MNNTGDVIYSLNGTPGYHAPSVRDMADPRHSPTVRSLADDDRPYTCRGPDGRVVLVDSLPAAAQVDSLRQTALVPVAESRQWLVRRGEHQQLTPVVRRHLANLKGEANSWVLIGIVGFFLGFGVISGPLTWKKGADIRNEFEKFGLEPVPEANVAYYTGVLSTMLVGLSLAAFAILMLLFTV